MLSPWLRRRSDRLLPTRCQPPGQPGWRGQAHVFRRWWFPRLCGPGARSSASWGVRCEPGNRRGEQGRSRERRGGRRVRPGAVPSCSKCLRRSSDDCVEPKQETAPESRVPPRDGTPELRGHTSGSESAPSPAPGLARVPHPRVVGVGEERGPRGPVVDAPGWSLLLAPPCRPQLMAAHWPSSPKLVFGALLPPHVCLSPSDAPSELRPGSFARPCAGRVRSLRGQLTCRRLRSFPDLASAWGGERLPLWCRGFKLCRCFMWTGVPGKACFSPRKPVSL